MKERHTVHFSGRVQGVGFRYTTKRIADEFEVTGYVQNLPDGRVILVAEGDSKELNRFVDRIKSVMAGNIDRVTVDKTPATGEFGSFAIKY